jgi:hypothetical protein
VRGPRFPSSHMMLCEERTRLLGIYEAKVSDHSVVIHGLSANVGKISKQEYDRIWNLAEQARTEVKAASVAFYQHMREHGC